MFKTYLDWATTPTTSAYRSATRCMLDVFGPVYLRHSICDSTITAHIVLNHYIDFDCTYTSLAKKKSLPFFIFEVLKGQVNDFLNQAIQKRMQRDLEPQWQRNT